MSQVLPDQYDEDSWLGWGEYFLDAFGPGTYYKAAKEPTLRNLYHASIVPVTGTAAMWYMGYLSTMAGQGLTLTRSMAVKGHKIRTVAGAVTRYTPVVVRGIFSPMIATAAGVLATAVTGAWAYEMYVNNPLRDAHNADIDWFGPFASGFGTVV